MGKHKKKHRKSHSKHRISAQQAKKQRHNKRRKTKSAFRNTGLTPAVFGIGSDDNPLDTLTEDDLRLGFMSTEQDLEDIAQQCVRVFDRTLPWDTASLMFALVDTGLSDGDAQIAIMPLSKGRHRPHDGDTTIYHDYFGVTVPRNAFAVAAYTEGWAAPPDSQLPYVRPSQHPQREEVRQVCILDRLGNYVASTLYRNDGRVLCCRQSDDVSGLAEKGNLPLFLARTVELDIPKPVVCVDSDELRSTAYSLLTDLPNYRSGDDAYEDIFTFPSNIEDGSAFLGVDLGEAANSLQNIPLLLDQQDIDWISPTVLAYLTLDTFRGVDEVDLEVLRENIVERMAIEHFLLHNVEGTRAVLEQVEEAGLGNILAQSEEIAEHVGVEPDQDNYTATCLAPMLNAFARMSFNNEDGQPVVFLDDLLVRALGNTSVLDEASLPTEAVTRIDALISRLSDDLTRLSATA